MLSRRLARIKTMQQMYAFTQSPSEVQNDILNNLFKVFYNTYEVYLSLLMLPVAMNDAMQELNDMELKKFSPNKDTIRLNNLLADNDVAQSIFEVASDYKKVSPINWYSDSTAMFNIVKEIKEQEFVQDYMVFDQHTHVQQIYLLEQIYEYLFDCSENFNDWMEEQYGVWYDDEPTLNREIFKVLKSAEFGNLAISKPILKSTDEVLYSMQLLHSATTHEQELADIIANTAINWDINRISIIDLIIMKLALCEFLYFEEIPVKVTINEYLEVAKSHSSEQSAKFINGILDPIKNQLLKEGKINKKGKGLK